MPLSALRPCAYPRCPVLGRTPRCPQHTKQVSQAKHQAYDLRRGTRHERGYDSRWVRYRDWWFRQEGAQLCGYQQPDARHHSSSQCRAQGRVTLATVVDHSVPIQGKDDPRFFDPLEHESLCDPCHQTKRQRESQAARRPMVEPIPEVVGRRVVVCGPPGAGKSTWVKGQAKPWDLVWDLDEVASVIGYQGEPIPRETRGSLPWQVAKAVLVMRDALMAWLSRSVSLGVDVYVIVADPVEAHVVAKSIGATTVVAMTHRGVSAC